MKLGFGPFELDLATCQVRRDGTTVPMQPRVFGTLRYLIEHRDRVVGKQEMLDALWGGVQLNAVAVPWTINRVRKALGEHPDDGTIIETVRGHGYRFVAELHVLDEASAPSEGAPAQSAKAEAWQSLVERPFVGRSAVMLQLTAAIKSAAEGHGRLYLLTGEAGIGKTRCIDELAEVARRRGVQVWLGRCFEQDLAPAFWPFIQIIRAACSDSGLPESLRNEGEAMLLAFEPRSPEAQRRANLSDDDRFWLLDRLCRWLRRCGKAQVRVIAIDDLHCADESSLQALSLLAPMLAQSRLLVLASVRQSDSAVAGSGGTPLSSRLRPNEHIPLLGLHSDDVQSYLCSVLDENLALQLHQPLYARTAGNPLFLHELSQVVAAHYEREGRVELESVRLPSGVTEVISSRLQQLPASTRVLLDAACVIGNQFEVSVLQRVAKLSASDALAGLQASVQAQIVRPASDGSTHSFVHPLMQEVLYAQLSTGQRAQLHAEVGLALEALGLIDPPLNELAFHFHHAPLEAYYARAARYGRLAGDAALDGLAYDEAVQRYAWALEAQTRAAPQDVAAACDLLLVSSFALTMAGRGLDGRKQCARAIELANEARLPEILIAAARLLRPSVWHALIADPLPLRALESALQMLPDDARAQRSRACAQLAALPPYSLQMESSRRMSAEAVRLAEGSDDPLLQLEAQRSRLFGCSAADSADEQLRVAEEMLLSDQEETWRWSVDAHFARYHATMQRGDAAAAEHALSAYKRLASRRRLRMHSWHCERMRAQRLLDAGQLDAAEQRFKELALEAERLRIPLGQVYYRMQCYALHFERTGKRLSLEQRELPERAAWAQRLPTYLVQRMQFNLELGRVEHARREFSSMAKDGFRSVSDSAFGLNSLVQLAGLAIELNELDAARALREALAPHASMIALSTFSLSRGCVARYLGQLEAFLGRWLQAREYFQLAIEVNARSGHELQRLHSQLGLADCLAQDRLRSERGKGSKLAAEVVSGAERLGAVALARSANELCTRFSQERSGLREPEVSRPLRRSSPPAKTQRRAHAKGT